MERECQEKFILYYYRTYYISLRSNSFQEFHIFLLIFNIFANSLRTQFQFELKGELCIST